MEAQVRLMQHWSDFIDGFAAGAWVIPIKRKAAAKR
jgi:hypothetical protein